MTGHLRNPTPMRVAEDRGARELALDRFGAAVLGLALVAGVAGRLRMYWMERSFWLDPAMLALNLVDKGFGELLGPLEMNQAAPPGFLLLSKAIGRAFGYSELSLTFLPLVFGLAALGLFLVLCLQVLEPRWAPLAFVPFAFSSTAIYYSGEFKQYSGDLLVAVALVWATLRVLDSRASGRWLAIWTLTGIAATWLSHPAVLVVAGCAPVLVASSWHCGRQARNRVLAASAVVGLHFALLYSFQMRPAASRELFAYHSSSFAPLAPSAGTLAWWGALFRGAVRHPLGLAGPVGLSSVALALGALGAAWAGWRDDYARRVVAVTSLPLAALVAASALGLYPMMAGEHDVHSRFLLFTLPMTLLLLAVGLATLAEALGRRLASSRVGGRRVAFGLGVTLGVILLAPSAVHIARWPTYIQQEMPPLVGQLRAQLEPDDVVYVYHAAVPAFRFYTRTEPISFVAGTPSQNPVDDMKRHFGGIERPRDLWVVIAHDYEDAEARVRAFLQRHGYEIERWAFPGVVLLRAQAWRDRPASGATKGASAAPRATLFVKPPRTTTSRPPPS